MGTEILFIVKNTDLKNIDLSKYTKIFINTVKINNTTRLTLSKYTGDILYILSNKDFDNLNDYFTISEVKKKANMIVDVQKNVKKSKQGNLFGFIKKK